MFDASALSTGVCALVMAAYAVSKMPKHCVVACLWRPKCLLLRVKRRALLTAALASLRASCRLGM
jgi:hypothetical protein